MPSLREYLASLLCRDWEWRMKMVCWFISSSSSGVGVCQKNGTPSHPFFPKLNPLFSKDRCRSRDCQENYSVDKEIWVIPEFDGKLNDDRR